MTPQDYFVAQARNNAWANHRLLSACDQLSQTALEARRTSFFPSLLATFNHILTVDWFYVDALEGGDLGRAAYADELPCKTIEDLRREQAAVDRRLVAHCADLDEGRLGESVRLVGRSRERRERRDRVLLHLFEHQIHHRGQAHAMLSGTEIAPPQLDEFFLAQDAGVRRDDFAALGWSEDDVWKHWPPADPTAVRE